MRIPIERQDAAAGATTIEKLFRFDLRPITLADMFAVRVVIVDADDVGRAAFPPVVANHGPRRVKCPGQVIERFYRVPVGMLRC